MSWEHVACFIINLFVDFCTATVSVLLMSTPLSWNEARYTSFCCCAHPWKASVTPCVQATWQSFYSYICRVPKLNHSLSVFRTLIGTKCWCRASERSKMFYFYTYLTAAFSVHVKHCVFSSCAVLNILLLSQTDRDGKTTHCLCSIRTLLNKSKQQIVAPPWHGLMDLKHPQI